METRKKIISKEEITNEKELLQAAIKLQCVLIKELPNNYSKAFQAEPRAGLFKNQKFFEEKKMPIAKTLLNLAAAKLKSLPDVIYFVSKCKECVSQNAKVDKKKGDLGKLLDRFTAEFNELHIAANFLIKELQENAQIETEVLYHGLALFEQVEISDSYDINDKRKRLCISAHMAHVPEFHIKKLTDIKERYSKNSILVQEIENILKNISEPLMENRNKFKKTLLDKINLNQLKRISTDTVSLILRTKFLKMLPVQQVKFLVRRELLSDYVSALQIYAKNFLWQLHMNAVNGGLNTLLTSKNGRSASYKGVNIINITKQFYNEKQKLLEDDGLAKILLSLNDYDRDFDSVGGTLEKLAETINEIISDYLKKLDLLNNLTTDSDWEILWHYDNTDWSEALLDFTKKTIIKALQLVNQLPNPFLLPISQSMGNDSYFSWLPKEMRDQIYSELSMNDYKKLRCVSKSFYHDELLSHALNVNKGASINHSNYQIQSGSSFFQLPPDVRREVYKYLTSDDAKKLRQSAKLLYTDTDLFNLATESSYVSSLYFYATDIVKNLNRLDTVINRLSQTQDSEVKKPQVRR